MKRLLKSLFVIAGLAMAMGVANAQTGSTVVSQFFGPTLEGTYSVNVTETAPLSNVFNVTVTELTSNPSLPTPPGAFLDQITLKFFTGAAFGSTQVGVTSGSGGTSGGAWMPIIIGGKTITFSSPTDPANVVLGVPFTGVIDLSSLPKIVNGSQVAVDLQNSGTGNGVITLTPESSSWLLLLAAVLPLGLLALRRRHAASRMV